MADPAVEFRRCLENLDIEGVRRIWAETHKHLPQPVNDEQTLIQIHMARAGSKSMAHRLRLYSHQWLTERNLPSPLPNHLRPKNEQVPSVLAEAAGLAVISKVPEAKTYLLEKLQASALEAFADGVRNPAVLRGRIAETVRREKKIIDQIKGDLARR